MSKYPKFMLAKDLTKWFKDIDTTKFNLGVTQINKDLIIIRRLKNHLQNTNKVKEN